MKSACQAHLTNPPHIGESCKLGGSGHLSHERRPLRDVLITNPWKIRGAELEGLAGSSHKFLKALVGATGIEPVTPPV